MFEYSADALTLISADAIQPMQKRAVTPGLLGAGVVVEAEFEWLDADGKTLRCVQSGIPLGMLSNEESGTRCEILIPEAGVVVIRLEGPDADEAPFNLAYRSLQVRTNLSYALPVDYTPPVFLTSNTFSIPAATKDAGLPPPGPFSVKSVFSTGPDSNRLVIVVLGDGYTAANLSANMFDEDVAGLVDAFTGKALWDTYFNVANVYQVDVESNESGADREDGPNGTMRDTYLNSSFWSYGIERLLTIDSTGMTRAIAAANAWVGAGVWDYIFVLVNSTKYGGAGGSISVSSVNASASEVVIHEFGHTFAQLADEYSYPYPGYPPGDPEPNVDFDFAYPNLKWNYWVENGTPLPTPDTIEYDNVVGAFVGARYLTSGIHRPFRSCIMNVLNKPFCPVCAEQHILVLLNQLSLCDTIAPDANSSVQVSNSGAQFLAGPTNLQGLQFEWRRNGAIIAGATGTALTVFPHQLSLGAGPDTYSLTVSHETPLVRKEPIQDTFAWTLNSNEAELLEVWVKNDFAGTEAGTYDNPYNTAAEAVNRVSAGGNLVLRSNSRNVGETITISKPMTIDSRDTP